MPPCSSGLLCGRRKLTETSGIGKEVPRAARIDGYVKISGLLEALCKFPVAVVIHVYNSIPTYKKGTYSKPIDEKEPIHHHCVLVVGFSASPSGKKYHLVPNSWGYWVGKDGML
ncbi:ananain-like [Cornus florida]|uniref:ananain-like n=1 Tax=Cornus florida TaxID=4283 RepID=UPI002896C877|nr:ananain-like [Cornus florida]